MCPPRLLTTQVKWADLPAAAVIFSKGETKPGSKPVTEIIIKSIVLSSLTGYRFTRAFKGKVNATDLIRA